ncbi:uncharacterized protein LOC143033367 [Oratosquilla oratoria]|uniref:uncharacterized protein LOC143033367 n=1 Tax=Oratosquilla oratoria TaxID=337810 RepID=UPI003F767064
MNPLQFTTAIPILLVGVILAFSQGHLIGHDPPQRPFLGNSFPGNGFPIPGRPFGSLAELQHHLMRPKLIHSSTLAKINCNLFCRVNIKHGLYTCCDEMIQDPLGQCPGYRSMCPVNIYRHNNMPCVSDSMCQGRKCCYDTCLRYSICQERIPILSFGFKAKNMTDIEDDTSNITTTEPSSGKE